MSAYTQALRMLAEILEAHPEWEKKAVVNTGNLRAPGVGNLNIHPYDTHLGDEIRQALGGEWRADCTDDGKTLWTSAYDLCGFREVTIFKAQS